MLSDKERVFKINQSQESGPSKEITPLEDESKRTWKVIIDGKEVTPKEVIIESDGYGRLILGERPEGFHGWWFEPENGGVMTVPWVRTPDGEILIGLVHEQRPNMGPEKVWCAPGGFINKDETPEEAQARETREESGLDSRKAEPLDGLPVNSDRLYMAQDPHKGEGMRIFGLELSFDDLEQNGEFWTVKSTAVSHEKEAGLYFMPWQKAMALSADSLTLAGIGKLLAKVL